MSNINDANQVIATVLYKLYEAFPVRLDWQQILGWEQITGEKTKYYEMIKWLENEGFLRYKDDWGGILVGVVLTSKGYKLLNSSPEILQSGEYTTTGQKLGHALQSGSTELVRAIVNEIISAANKSDTVA